MKQHGLYQSAHTAREPAKPTGEKECKVSPYPSPFDSSPAPKRRKRNAYRKGSEKYGSTFVEDGEEKYLHGNVTRKDACGGNESWSSGEVNAEDPIMNPNVKNQPPAYEQPGLAMEQPGLAMEQSGLAMTQPGLAMEQQGLAIEPQFYGMETYHPVMAGGGYHLKHDAAIGVSEEELVFREFLVPEAFEDGGQGVGGGFETSGHGWVAEGETDGGNGNVLIVD